MNKKTILYVGGFELPDKNAAAHRVINNGKVFRKLEYDVVYIGISHATNQCFKEYFEGFECWSIPYPSSGKQWIKYLSDVEYIKERTLQIEGLEGIVFYNFPAVALAKGLSYCKRQHLWSVADVTEWYMASKKNPFFFFLKQLDTSIRMRFFNKKADGIISISSYLTNYYSKKNGTCIIQVPPLIDKNEPKWERSLPSNSKSKKQLVYAGSPGDVKDNLAMVLESVFFFKDKLDIHIIGIEKNFFESQCEKTFTKKYLGKHVIFHGKISHQECLQWIKESDFQIFIRHNNLVTKAGFPTKFGESIACGTPVITNLSSNIGDYLKEGKNGFIVSDVSVDGINEVLQKVADLPEKEINCMKNYCIDFMDFDYIQQVDNMAIFLKEIEKRKGNKE